MIYKRVGIFALCAMLCGIFLGCKKEPEVVFLSLPSEENVEDQPSLMENIQEVAEQMLPQMDSTESTEDNNPAIIQTPAPATANMGEETANLPPDIDPNLPMVALTFDDGPALSAQREFWMHWRPMGRGQHFSSRESRLCSIPNCSSGHILWAAKLETILITIKTSPA